jgi:NADPH-dependent glutamate synthase beta subunit-like oxidoreductase
MMLDRLSSRGTPAFTGLKSCSAYFGAQVERVTIVGLGNVALDCARVLLRQPGDLAPTDIAEHALAALRRSAVRRVDLVGRRGAVQVRAHARILFNDHMQCSRPGPEC